MSGKKIFGKIVCLFLSALILSCAVSAGSPEEYEDVPYKTYTYWQGYKEKKPVPIKAVYEYSKTVYTSGFSMARGFHLTYFCFGNDGNLYALDGENGKILIMNKAYEPVKLIESFTSASGEKISLNGAEGLFVTEEGSIFVADTANNRVIVTSPDGNVSKIVEKPESRLIPDDVIFLPKRILKDGQGFIYVLSDGCYYGAMKFDSDFNFIGFYGANTVSVSIGSAISGFFKNLFATETKRMNDIQKIPYTFLDFCLDSDGMILTTTANTQISSGQIRRLSPGGNNVLSYRFNYKTTSGDSFNFGDISGVTNEENIIKKNYFGAIASDENFFYALDTATGRIFVYDFSCSLICVFSGGFGMGEQSGVFKQAANIAVAENGDVLVTDTEKNSITVFSETEYGSLIKNGAVKSGAGRYDEALPFWEKVNILDKNNQLALIGIAKAALNSGDYGKAMSYSAAGLDRETYVNAHAKMQTESLKKHFGILFAALLLLVGGLTVFLIISSKKKIVLIKNRKLNVALSSLLHPFESFRAVQDKDEGSLAAAVVFMLLFFIGSVCTQIYAGFMYVIPERDNYNVVYTFLGTVGLVLLWTAVNWGVSVLFEGKGRIKKIFICSCYSLYPLILYSAIFILLSYFVSPSAVSFIPVFNAVCVIYFVFMMLTALMTVHEFSFSRSVGTAVFSVVGMAIAAFLVFMTIMLCQDFIGFVVSVIQEAVFR